MFDLISSFSLKHEQKFFKLLPQELLFVGTAFLYQNT